MGLWPEALCAYLVSEHIRSLVHENVQSSSRILDTSKFIRPSNDKAALLLGSYAPTNIYVTVTKQGFLLMEFSRVVDHLDASSGNSECCSFYH